jgi:putative flippase GtrA
MMAFLREYMKTLLVSGSGALLSVLVTAILAEWILGREQYFLAYLIGVGVGVLASFYLFSRKVFSPGNHSGLWRLTLFLGYMVILVLIQSFIVRAVVEIVGVNWYLPVIIVTMLGISGISHLIYTYVIFR